MYASIIALFFLSTLRAFAADDLCWTKEEDPNSKQPYASLHIWQHERSHWLRFQKSQYNIIELVKAYQVYKQERDRANAFRDDKLAHCFIGCRVSQTTSLRTARYIGWLKEARDLTDCKIETHFEIADYEATVKGAMFGENKKVNCEQACKTNLEN
ncbi:MAG: hypothetical protein JNL11_18100 [Bdellovibrionaceae bacterium]|nr:hypothetical protein [Pseudobdellovibrionaceae bacterium]